MDSLVASSTKQVGLASSVQVPRDESSGLFEVWIREKPHCPLETQLPFLLLTQQQVPPTEDQMHFPPHSLLPGGLTLDASESSSIHCDSEAGTSSR